MQRASILVIASAGLITTTVVSEESYHEVLKEAERESPHQHERMEAPGRDALEEAEHESPHQRELQELSRDPREEALEANKRERP